MGIINNKMANRTPFAPNEWYHCYTRGVDKRRVFENTSDYERFLQLLYLCNSDPATKRSDLLHTTTATVMARERSEPMVAVGAYCLMPNHFHLLLKEKTEGGISQFMRKVGISYAMYFNIKRERVGNVFVRPFRSKHVADDLYFRRVVQYIHLNAADLYNTAWKQCGTKSLKKLERQLQQYRYSSMWDYTLMTRPERAILDTSAFNLIKDGLPPLATLLAEAISYHAEMSR